jgi:hypothetical protein
MHGILTVTWDSFFLADDDGVFCEHKLKAKESRDLAIQPTCWM